MGCLVLFRLKRSRVFLQILQLPPSNPRPLLRVTDDLCRRDVLCPVETAEHVDSIKKAFEPRFHRYGQSILGFDINPPAAVSRVKRSETIGSRKQTEVL
jgi:hypothetical protein